MFNNTITNGAHRLSFLTASTNFTLYQDILLLDNQINNFNHNNGTTCVALGTLQEGGPFTNTVTYKNVAAINNHINTDQLDHTEEIHITIKDHSFGCKEELPEEHDQFTVCGTLLNGQEQTVRGSTGNCSSFCQQHAMLSDDCQPNRTYIDAFSNSGALSENGTCPDIDAVAPKGIWTSTTQAANHAQFGGYASAAGMGQCCCGASDCSIQIHWCGHWYRCRSCDFYYSRLFRLSHMQRFPCWA